MLRTGDGRSRYAARLAVAAFAVVLVGAGCVTPVSTEIPADGVHVGVLLPFSGEFAATGPHVERALVLAAEHVEAVGGIGGQPIRLIPLDTHSSAERGIEAAEKLLDERGLRIVIGPEEVRLAQSMRSLVRSTDALHVMPSVTAPPIRDLGAGAWVRLSASSKVMGCVLAERAVIDGIERAQVISNDDDYSFVLKSAFETAFGARVGLPEPGIPVRDGESYGDAIAALQRSQPDGIFLFTAPSTGASLVLEWSIVGGNLDPRWYFSPTLESEAFPRNTTPGSIEGMLGVSPRLPASADVFAELFAERWQGEAPSSAAYRYYDALVLIALAIESAARTDPAPTADTLRQHMQRVSSPPGETVEWTDLARAFELVRAGTDIDLSGASGELDLDARGDLVRTSAVVGLWTVENGRIADTGQAMTCPDDLFSLIPE